jgi:predicted RNA-binding protein with PIN domain
MNFIVDGHNLIPHMPGVHLQDPDDEIKLVRILQDYCRLRRKTLEVYFDQAATGHAGERRFGQVRAIFVPKGMTADQAIMNRLSKLSKRARNVSVVSSDRQVQQAARAAHAEVISSESFVAAYQKLVEERPEIDPRNQPLSTQDVQAWEKIFTQGQKHGGNEDSRSK